MRVGGRGLLERPAGSRTRHGLRLRAQGATEAWAGDRRHQTPPPLPHPYGQVMAAALPAERRGYSLKRLTRGIWPSGTYRGTYREGDMCEFTQGRTGNQQGPSPPGARMLRPDSQLPGQEESISGETEPLLSGGFSTQCCSRRHSPTPAAPSAPSPEACWARRPASWYPRAASRAREEAELA